MKHFNRIIKKFLFGKPVKGTSIIHHSQQFKTTTPFNLTYKAWLHIVGEHGYQDIINFFSSNKKDHPAR